MTMAYFFRDSIDPLATYDLDDHGRDDSAYTGAPMADDLHIFREKLRVPTLNGDITRPRLVRALERSRRQFPATLITGRSGTGKTSIAATFARDAGKTCWYTVDAADTDWPVFARYFSESLTGCANREYPEHSADGFERSSQGDIAYFLLRHLVRDDPKEKDSADLIVLDDIHHVFDTDWFEDFFYLLICSLPVDSHLLLLCRSKPPAPLWRMRSKQMLNVLDEKELAFDAEETQVLSTARGIPISRAEMAREKSFGRISKLLQFAV